jgi:hypothetical protein
MNIPDPDHDFFTHPGFRIRNNAYMLVCFIKETRRGEQISLS